MDRMSKSGLNKREFVGISGTVGRGQLGCLACSKCQVLLLSGAIPDDRSTLHAFPYKPTLARETADCNGLCVSSARVSSSHVKSPTMQILMSRKNFHLQLTNILKAPLCLVFL